MSQQQGSQQGSQHGLPTGFATGLPTGLEQGWKDSQRVPEVLDFRNRVPNTVFDKVFELKRLEEAERRAGHAKNKFFFDGKFLTWFPTGFPTGSPNMVPKQGSQAGFPSRVPKQGCQTGFPSRVPKQGSQAGFPNRVPNRVPNKFSNRVPNTFFFSRLKAWGLQPKCFGACRGSFPLDSSRFPTRFPIKFRFRVSGFKFRSPTGFPIGSQCRVL